LVNTAAFAQRDQVTTISGAVLLLGFERIRTVATGLILFEHLQAQAKTPELVDTLTMSLQRDTGAGDCAADTVRGT